MKPFYCLTTLLFLFISPAFSQPQDGSISGKIVGEAGKPLNGAVLRLLLDTLRVKTALTDSTGIFSLKNIHYGSYKLSINVAGHKTTTSSIDINAAHKTVDSLFTLEAMNHELKEASVIGKKQFVEQKIDRTVLNVDALISNASLNALEVLENSPGVIVTNDGSVSLKGKGVTIYIDDKQTYLSGADLANYLKSLPASALDKIELMPNPPARYDAAGNGGIINIRRKKTKAAGFNAGISLSYNQGKYARTNNSVNFNYRKEKMNIFGNGSFGVDNWYNDLDIYRYYYAGDGSLRSTFFQNSFIRNTGYGSNARLGVDYFLSSKSTLGILATGNYRPGTSKTINKSAVADAAGNTDSLITADNREKSTWKNAGINLNYLYRDTTGTELSVDLDYIMYNSLQNQTFLNHIYAPDGGLKSQDGLNGNLPSQIDIYSAKTDYSHAFKGSAKLDAGAKVSYINTDNSANYFTVINNVTATDYGKTNHFLYKETISAAYINLSKDWKHFSIQAGLRMENTNSDGHQLGNAYRGDSSFKRNYTNLFPTLYLLYKLDSASNNQLAFSYGRRIDRPFYQDLNPFISPLDKFSVYVGNPYLRPAFTNVFELSHIFRNKITTAISYSAISDVVQETIDLSNSIYVSRPANIGKNSVLALGVSGTVQPAKWWSLTTYAEVQNRYYKGVVYNYPLDTSLLYFGMNLYNQFTIGKGWAAELSGMYGTGLLIGQIISGQTGFLNVGASKKLFNNKAAVRVMFRDVLRTNLNHGVITSIQSAYATYHNWGDSRNVSIAFSYNIGGKANSPRQRTSGAETEQGRVKN